MPCDGALAPWVGAMKRRIWWSSCVDYGVRGSGDRIGGVSGVGDEKTVTGGAQPLPGCGVTAVTVTGGDHWRHRRWSKAGSFGDATPWKANGGATVLVTIIWGYPQPHGPKLYEV